MWIHSFITPRSTAIQGGRNFWVLDIYPFLPPGSIWHKVFFKEGIRRKGEWAQAKIHLLLVNACHRLT